ncbi:murein biosynthesis integral membrane protein MurJ [Salinibius halmophilus]|uniref:murein biosynthesis integral membrane protein MurJ n=1 Tax=Salinibius halmophilus TaxID=1853216 RepID=UPI001F163DDC|nr:murein biosynthesis integral membrane protein MurJ [Salinibius halmophilus]
MAKQGLLRSGIIVSAGTLVSRVLGFVRDMVFASYLGAGGATDAFYVAFKVPNFFRRLFAEGAFSQAFVPVLNEYKALANHAEVQRYVAKVTTMLAAVVGAVVLLGIVGADYVAQVFAWGYRDEADKLAITAELLRITFPYLFFISLVSVAAGIQNAYNQFAVPALTPVLLNLSLISAVVWLSPYFEVAAYGAAWGVLIAGVAQLLLQIPFLARLGMLGKPELAPKDEGVRKTLKLMGPALFGASVAQINLLLDTLLASLLADGAVSWLYYADRLSELPLGLIGIAIGTVVLPTLSVLHAKADKQAFQKTINWAIFVVLLVGVPAAMALIVLPVPLQATLFLRGQMQASDILASSDALIAYAIGLPAFMLVKVLVPGWFARQDTKTPVKIGLWAMAVSMGLNLILIWPLGHVGLALSTSLAAWFNAACLYIGLRKLEVAPPMSQIIKQSWAAVVAGCVMGVVLLFGKPETDWWLMASEVDRILWLAIMVVGGMVSFTIVALALGIRPRMLKSH